VARCSLTSSRWPVQACSLPRPKIELVEMVMPWTLVHRTEATTWPPARVLRVEKQLQASSPSACDPQVRLLLAESPQISERVSNLQSALEDLTILHVLGH